jgi:hypothetical protein
MASILDTIDGIFANLFPGFGTGGRRRGKAVSTDSFARMPDPQDGSPKPPPSPFTTTGYVFFSPALHPNNGAQIDVAAVSAAARASDSYSSSGDRQPMLRPFILGPAPAAPSGRAWPPDFSASYKPALNNAQYGLISNKDPSSRYRGGEVKYGMPGVVYGELEDTTTHEVTVVLV